MTDRAHGCAACRGRHKHRRRMARRLLGLPPMSKDVRRKLSDEDVRTIRELYATGRYTQDVLGERFGVNPATISRIVTRTWRAAA